MLDTGLDVVLALNSEPILSLIFCTFWVTLRERWVNFEPNFEASAIMLFVELGKMVGPV